MSTTLVQSAVAEVVVPPMSREDAEKLDRRIRNLAGAARNQLDSLGALVAKAKTGRIHEALEYPSWTAYLGDALQDLCSGEGIEVRREIVVYLHDAGMSERAIAAATKTSQPTVHRDLVATADEVIHRESAVNRNQPDEYGCRNSPGVEDFNPAAEPVITDLDESDIAATAETPPVDLHDVPANAAATDAPSPAAMATTGLDGKRYPRKRPKRPTDEQQQKKPTRKKHAEVLFVLLSDYLKPAAETLDEDIIDPATSPELVKLDRSVTAEIARELIEDFDLCIKTFSRVRLLLKQRAGETQP